MKYRLLKLPTFATLIALSVLGCTTGKKHGVSSKYTALQAELHTSGKNASARDNLPVLNGESTLDDYLEYAALNNPGLEAAFNRWKAALERVPQAISLPDPTFTYTNFIQELETRTGPQRNRFGLAQMFPWFGTLSLRGDVAFEAANIEKQRYEAVKLSLFYRVKDAYYEYYYLSRAITVNQEMFDLLTYIETVARTRYAAGTVGHADVIKAQVELGKLEDRLGTLQDFRGPVAARLNAALNRRKKEDLPWPDSIPEESVTFTDTQIFEWLAENNPDLRAIDHMMAKEKQSVDLAGKDFYPDLTVGLNYMETGGARMPDTRGSGDDPVAVIFSVNIPIWRQKYRAGVREAEHRYDAAERQRRDKENTLTAETEMRLYRFRDAERKIDLYRDTLVPKADQALNVAQQAFAAGRSSFLDVIDAERTLLEFKLAYERALADRAQRLAEIEMFIGREIPHENGS